MLLCYLARRQALYVITIGTIVFLNMGVVSATRARVSGLHASGLGFDQVSRMAVQLRGGHVKEAEEESPCTKAVRGVNVTLPPAGRVKEAGVLHFNKLARIDQTKAIGFDACATQVFKEVKVNHDLPKLFPDAMALHFAPGTFVENYTFQTSLYEKDHTYCAAPIALDDGTVPYNASNGFRYWAIGKDCCKKIGDFVQFTCGNLSVNVFPPPPPNISLNESIAAAMAGKPINKSNATQEVLPEPQWATFGIIPTNPMIVDRFFDVVGMAENQHGLKAVSELGIQVVWVSDDLHAPQPDWLHLPGMKPPICHVPNICVAPIIGTPLPPPPAPAAPAGAPGAPGAPGFAPAAAPGAAPGPAASAKPPPLDPWNPNPPGPLYYAVGRGCCSADRLEPGFGCIPSPLAHSGVVLKDKSLRFEWLQGLKKSEAVFELNSNASEVIFLWWDTASTAAWECHKAYYPWLDDEKPEYAPPPKYMGCTTNSGQDCKTDADCAHTPDLICHGALRKCICSKKCWFEEHAECRGWRKER